MDDLELANASIRRGARLAQFGFPGFAIFASLFVTKMMLEVDAAALAVLVILVAAATSAVIFVHARRLGRFHLAVDGIHAPNGWTLPWNAITRAEYHNGSFSLHDGAGRELRVAIMFAIPQATVLAAIRARLPGGIQIVNDPLAGSRPN